MSGEPPHTSDLPPPSRSGRLLSLVRKLVDYGKHLAATLGQRTTTPTPDETLRLDFMFGTADLRLILARIAQGLRRAAFLEAKITHAAPRLDAQPKPKPPPSRRAPRTAQTEDQPRPPRPPVQPEPQPTDTASLLARLPTEDQIAAAVRHQRIGAVIADICRDLGIVRGHPLWDEIYAAINEYGGNFIRLTMERLNRNYPIAHIVARLRAKPETPPEPAGTGPPVAIPV